MSRCQLRNPSGRRPASRHRATRSQNPTGDRTRRTFSLRFAATGDGSWSAHRLPRCPDKVALEAITLALDRVAQNGCALASEGRLESDRAERQYASLALDTAVGELSRVVAVGPSGARPTERTNVTLDGNPVS